MVKEINLIVLLTSFNRKKTVEGAEARGFTVRMFCCCKNQNDKGALKRKNFPLIFATIKTRKIKENKKENRKIENFYFPASTIENAKEKHEI